MEPNQGVDPPVPNVPIPRLPNPSVAPCASSDPFPGAGRATSLTSSVVDGVERQETEASVYYWLHSQYEVSSFQGSTPTPSIQGSSSGARNVPVRGQTNSPTPSESISVRMSRPTAHETARVTPNQVDDSETGELIGGALYALWNGPVAPLTSGPIPPNPSNPFKIRDDSIPQDPRQGSEGALAFDDASVGVAAHQNTSNNVGARSFDHHEQPIEQPIAWRPETGPPERFLPPEFEGPVPDPIKISDSKKRAGLLEASDVWEILRDTIRLPNNMFLHIGGRCGHSRVTFHD